MTEPVPCLRSDEPGTNNQRLRAILAEASANAGQDLGPMLLSLNDHHDFLLATWVDELARDRWSSILSQAWQAHVPGAAFLHFLHSPEDWEYDDDDIDAG